MCDEQRYSFTEKWENRSFPLNMSEFARDEILTLIILLNLDK